MKISFIFLVFFALSANLFCQKATSDIWNKKQQKSKTEKDYYYKPMIRYDWKNQAIELGITEEALIPGEKNPASALILGIFFPGLGQIYNEKIGTGFTFFAISTVALGASRSLKHDNSKQLVALFISAAAWLGSAIEATFGAMEITREARTKRAIIEALRRDYSTSFLDNMHMQPYYNGKGAGINISYNW